MKTLHRTVQLLMLLAASMSAALAADKVDETSMGEAVERHLPSDELFTQWVQDPERIAEELGDTLEIRETAIGGLETVKLSNLVPPIRFESGVANIPGTTVESLGRILTRMRDRTNVRVHLVGHADNRPLSPELEKIYGDNAGLSRERAGTLAEHLKNALALPPEAMSYEWAGDAVPIASNRTEEGRALNRRVEVEVWYDEAVERISLAEFLVPHEIEKVKVCRMETVCKLQYIEGHARRARVKNLIPPLHFAEESIDVNEDFMRNVQQAFDNLSDKQNVAVRFVGFTDDAPLAGRTERLYGDHVGLSKAHARRVALAIQDRLGLPSTVVQSDGRGATRPIGPNQTARGRDLNRRVEVEFWYDDPLQELPDDLQLCPEDANAVTVERSYDPPWGRIEDIDFVDGQPVLPPGYVEKLARAMAEVSDKANPRLRFIGFTRNERLARRTASVYGDDIGLSASRARRTMEQAAQHALLESVQMEFEGHGYVHSNDVVNAGFIQGETSHVSVQVVYDELAVFDDYEGVDITRVRRELSPESPLALNLMRITVDGKPIDDPKRTSSDIQRCTDVALKGADIQFGFDNMRSAPRLSVSASTDRIVLTKGVDFQSWYAPSSLRIYTQATPVQFRMYANYHHFIDRAEVRVFANGQSIESEPMAIIDVGPDGLAAWDPLLEEIRSPVVDLAYVLRAYGSDGNFDETAAQPLWVYHDGEVKQEPLFDQPAPLETPPPELLSAYGENSLAVHNIGLSSGTVSVRGSIAPEQEVWVAGRPIPVDADGSFVTEEILPTGAHTVEVAIIDSDGSGELYLRDLDFKHNDWFYVGMADLTLAQNTATGPIDLLQGANSTYDYDSNVDGRLAFFVNGKWGDHWKLTASADTREGKLDELFSNFMDKSPDSLFRRLDPDYYYPTFGDDSIVEEMAPSMGKFFVRLGRDDDYGQWGNFKVAYMNNELAQVDRGLYGANFHYQSDSTTDFGDRLLTVDGFAAQPGTVASREEFRGTGGSLYYLRRQDILAGSERARVEIRDKASGIVTGVLNLTPAMDYDIDYLQGRIMLAEPLAATVDDHLLVRSGAVSGDEAYLVVRYEYSSGFEEIDALSTGGEGHYWLGDHVRLGVTANQNEEGDIDSSLKAADLTLRWSAGSWLKVQQATSEGLVSLPEFSNDGGFGFNGYNPAAFVGAKADAERADISVAFDDIVGFSNGRVTMYTQEVGAGYSAPGLTATSDMRNYGGSLSLPIGDRFSLGTKVDTRIQERGITTRAEEYSIGYRIGERWDLSAGYRRDENIDKSIIVPLTQQQGERVDAVMQLGYNSGSTWNAYAFSQDTLSTTGDRPENARFGAGGSFMVTEKVRLEAEASDGDLGPGGRIGTNYTRSEHTSMYLSYVLDNERTVYGLPSGRGSEGNLVAGVKSRIADSTSVFLEERYQHTATSTGLTHGTGISFAASDSWNMGLTTDIGTLQDIQTGAETERFAGGVQLGFAGEQLQISTGVEYRNDNVQQLDLGQNERKTWLYRNSFKYQMGPDGRLLGKFNHSNSESSLGTFFAGGYTEAVLGYAYRPVYNDRLNALVKYTYFYNMPTTEQIGLQNIAAEFIQKSHVASVDVTYDVTQNFSIGGKYAHRLGQVSLDRDNPVFFENNANLYVVRGDYRLGKNWEVLIEGRILDMPDLHESRMGGLATVSRYFGDHVKAGVGYNFTDFSDDLTDLSFDHSGFFLNLTGSM